MPKLAAVVEDLNTIPEALRDAYVQRDGKYVLDTDVDSHPAVHGLKSALERVKGDEKTARERLKAFGDADPEKVAQLLKDAEDAETKKAAAAGEFDKLKTQLIEKHQGELKKSTERAATLESALYGALAESAAVREITEAKGSAELLLPHVLKHIKVIEDEKATDPAKRFRAVVVDANGTPRVADGSGTPMSIAALVQEFRDNEKYAGAFQGSGASGSGASGSRHQAGPAEVRTKADLKTAADKSKYIGQYGRAAYIALPDK